MNQKEYLENIKNDLTLDQIYQLLIDFQIHKNIIKII